MWRTSNCRRGAGTGHPRRNALCRGALAGLLAAAILTLTPRVGRTQVWSNVVATATTTTPITTSCSHLASMTLTLATGAPSFICVVNGAVWDANGATATALEPGASIDGAANCGLFPAVTVPANATVAAPVPMVFSGVAPGTHTINIDGYAGVGSSSTAIVGNVLCAPQR